MHSCQGDRHRDAPEDWPKDAFERLGESGEHSSVQPRRKRSEIVHSNQITHRDLDQVIKDLKKMKRNRRDRYFDQDEVDNPLSFAIQKETTSSSLKIP